MCVLYMDKYYIQITSDYQLRLLGLLVILVSLWVILYFVPSILVMLFHTLLGNLMLLVMTLLIYSNRRMVGIVFGLLCLVLVRFSWLSEKDGFTTQSQTDFYNIQRTINPQTHFDMNVLGTQVSQDELDYFNRNGMWEWSPSVIAMYEEAVKRNPYVRTVPFLSTQHARTIYNQSAIVEVLSNQTKEGQFRINGVLVPESNVGDNDDKGIGTFGENSGLVREKDTDIIRCNLDTDQLERVHLRGTTPSKVNYTEMETLVPGFSFLQGACNPCDRACAYTLNVKGQTKGISDIWKYIWGIV